MELPTLEQINKDIEILKEVYGHYVLFDPDTKGSYREQQLTGSLWVARVGIEHGLEELLKAKMKIEAYEKASILENSKKYL